MFKLENVFINYLFQMKNDLFSEKHRNEEILKNIGKYSDNFPSSTDEIESALIGLFLLQDSYNLNITQFAKGNIR